MHLTHNLFNISVDFKLEIVPVLNKQIFRRFDVENENFFPTNVRIMIVEFILERQCEGVHRLVDSGCYSAAYPLHDVSKFFFYSYIFVVNNKYPFAY